MIWIPVIVVACMVVFLVGVGVVSTALRAWRRRRP